jgi:hypothetical protein
LEAHFENRNCSAKIQQKNHPPSLTAAPFLIKKLLRNLGPKLKPKISDWLKPMYEPLFQSFSKQKRFAGGFV